MLEADDEEGFTAAMSVARSQMGPAMQQEIAWRAKPYGEQPSDYATFKRVEEYRLGDLVKNITRADDDHRPRGRAVLARPIQGALRRA